MRRWGLLVRTFYGVLAGVDSETNLRDVLDKVDEISIDHVDDTHFFTLSQVFVGARAGVKTNLLFFTKGKKTEKIWYYDLTHVKVGKKSPMTHAHFGFGKNGEVLTDAELPAALTEPWTEGETSEGEFPSYARLLPKRGSKAGESRYSCTVDFAARRKQAREDMKPHTDTVARRARGTGTDRSAGRPGRIPRTRVRSSPDSTE